MSMIFSNVGGDLKNYRLQVIDSWLDGESPELLDNPKDGDMVSYRSLVDGVPTVTDTKVYADGSWTDAGGGGGGDTKTTLTVNVKRGTASGDETIYFYSIMQKTDSGYVLNDEGIAMASADSTAEGVYANVLYPQSFDCVSGLENTLVFSDLVNCTESSGTITITGAEPSFTVTSNAS